MNLKIIKMKSNFISIFSGVLLCLLFFNCSDSSRKNNQKELVNVSIAEADSIVVSDSTNLKKEIEKRFSKIYNPQTVSFNDGTIIDFNEHLDFNEISDNFLYYPEPDFKNYMSNFVVDSAGVLVENGLYHPTAIGKIAIKAINNYKRTKSEFSKKVFMDQVWWAEKNFYETSNYGFWYFTEPAPLYNLEAGWTSTFSQGTLMEVCLEAYRLTKEEKYAILVEKALKGFMVPIENGGFMRHWDENELWFEEYSTERPSRVINGTMYGLVGVYNVYRDLNSELARKIFESGVNTIKNHLSEYDAKYTSRYSLADWKDEVSLEHYHEGHVLQLLWLYKVTKDPFFKKYAKIFLENDRGAFMMNTGYQIDQPKIQNITASHTIDTVTNGVQNLTDEIWAYGGFWSSHKTTDLIIDFGQKRHNISALTLYHVNAKSKDVNFKLYAFDNDKNEWRYVQQFSPKYIKDKVAAYNLTGKFETFIEHYKIFENADSNKIKLIFEASPENIIAIREINFVFDRTDDLEYLSKKLDQHL